MEEKKDNDFTIIVNAREKSWNDKTISYDQVVILAFGSISNDPNIVLHEKYIIRSNLHELQDLDFIFICADAGAVKAYIIEYLDKNRIGFIDVGMGVEVSGHNALFGILRVTASRDGNSEQIKAKQRISFGDLQEEDEYHQNIQIAELNALNAALAVIKWKKLMGFYHMEEDENHSLYSIDDNSIINDDFTA